MADCTDRQLVFCTEAFTRSRCTDVNDQGVTHRLQQHRQLQWPGYDQTYQHNSEQQHNRVKQKQTQSNKQNPNQTRKYPESNNTRSRAEEGGGGGEEGCAGRVRLELQVLRWRGNLLVDVFPTGTDTRTVQTQPSTDTDRFTVTVTVPVRLSGRLCHLEMLRQSLQEGEVTVRQQHSTHTRSQIHVQQTDGWTCC